MKFNSVHCSKAFRITVVFWVAMVSCEGWDDKPPETDKVFLPYSNEKSFNGHIPNQNQNDSPLSCIAMHLRSRYGTTSKIFYYVTLDMVRNAAVKRYQSRANDLGYLNISRVPADVGADMQNLINDMIYKDTTFGLEHGLGCERAGPFSSHVEQISDLRGRDNQETFQAVIKSLYYWKKYRNNVCPNIIELFGRGVIINAMTQRWDGRTIHFYAYGAKHYIGDMDKYRFDSKVKIYAADPKYKNSSKNSVMIFDQEVLANDYDLMYSIYDSCIGLVIDLEN